ncbi:hypothetical protein CYMTET_27678 [Cymbomonas tetramitiformis]|uniref:beta-fructofuranosidase n=1 Tax=Cymbomonas tetramitiformis TaxID=36881 RepID=A0AAE0FPW9_9CHLO|nr:hypothetical protein CYMTET_27678 [Cymbomonas tetramitiformis]
MMLLLLRESNAVRIPVKSRGLDPFPVINSKSSFCPQYHKIDEVGLYDPSAPLLAADGTWHVWEDKGGWAHFESPDLLHWAEVDPGTSFSGLTGSVSVTPSGTYAFWPAGDQQSIQRAVSITSNFAAWNHTGAAIVTPKGQVGFRDPTRALKIGETYYLGVGCGVQGANRTQPPSPSVNFTHVIGALAAGGDLPGYPRNMTMDDARVSCGLSATCCGFTFKGEEPAADVTRKMYLKSKCGNNQDTSWNSYIVPELMGRAEICTFRADKDTLKNFTQVAPIFSTTHTFGYLDSNVTWHPEAQGANMMECPDMFPLANKHVILGSLFKTNQWWVGKIQGNPPEFTAERVGLLDYGQFYAAKTGTTASVTQMGDARRVLFAFTGWHEPTAIPSCGRAFVLPREVSLAEDGGLQTLPVAETKELRRAHYLCSSNSFQDTCSAPVPPDERSKSAAGIAPGELSEHPTCTPTRCRQGTKWTSRRR